MHTYVPLSLKSKFLEANDTLMLLVASLSYFAIFVYANATFLENSYYIAVALYDLMMHDNKSIVSLYQAT